MPAFDFVDEGISSVASSGAGDATLDGTAKDGHQIFDTVYDTAQKAIVVFYLPEPNNDIHDWEIVNATLTLGGTDTIARDSVLASSNGGSAITLTSTHRARVSMVAHIGGKINFEFPTTGTTRIGLNAGNDTMTGIDNTIIGSGAAPNMGSGQENVIIGKDAGDHATPGSTNVYIGKDAGTGDGSGNVAIGKDAMGGANNSEGSNNVVIGKFSGDAMTSADGVVFVGENAGGITTSGRRTVFLGSQAGDLNTSGQNNIYIGHRTNGVNSSSNQIAMGYRATANGANNGVFGSQFAGSHISDWYYNGHNSTTPDDVVLHGAGASGTDVAGANVTHAGGQGTGAGVGGEIRFQVAEAGTTGSSQNSLVTAGFIAEDGGMVWGSAGSGTQGAGTINAEGVYDDGTILTDYVFEKYYDGKTIEERFSKYKMKTLLEEIGFTRENKHLSTMVGRKEWEEKGSRSVGTLVSQLWETIETQFLYIKELNERVNTLEGIST